MYNIEFTSKSIFVPNVNVKLHSSFIPESLRVALKETVLAEENNILSLPCDNVKNKDWITSRLWHYNLFDYDYDSIRELKSFVYDEYIKFMREIGAIPTPVYGRCWVNIIRQNRNITPHHHADGHTDIDNAPQDYAYLSGNVCIETEHTSTYFRHPFLDKIYAKIPNKNSEMILFPSFMTHYADISKTFPRITISFDLITKEYYDIIGGKYCVMG